MECSPLDVVKFTREANQWLVGWAVELLAPGTDDRVVDLDCGIGNYSLPLARKAGVVLGVERESTLVTAAAHNAGINGLSNVAFRVADLDRIDGCETWLREGWDSVLLDPGRTGAAAVVKHMHVVGARRIVYVSCHPGTLARDAGMLVKDQGYRLEAAGIIDMFPHTAHVESIAVFEK